MANCEKIKARHVPSLLESLMESQQTWGIHPALKHREAEIEDLIREKDYDGLKRVVIECGLDWVDRYGNYKGSASDPPPEQGHSPLPRL